MATGSIKEELANCLGLEVASDPKLLAECQKICEIYGITPQELQYKWEAATYNHNNNFASVREATRFTSDSLAGVRDQIKRELEQDHGSAKRKTQVRSLASGVASINRNKMPFVLNRNMHAAQRVPEPLIKIEPDAVNITEISTGSRGLRVAGPSRVHFRGPKNDAESKKKRAYRYMFERTSERGQVLDTRIEEMAELVQQHYGIQEFNDAVNMTDEEVFVVGRIVHDLDSDAKLTESTLTLETSRRLSDHSGKRIPVRFHPALRIRGGAQGAGGLGLFPGAIVALKGRNGGTGSFSATEILVVCARRLAPFSFSPSMKPSPDDDSFSMYLASGPYTPDTDLSFKPWDSFSQMIRRTKPAVVVLLGPFVDTFHPLIQAGEIDQTPLDLFHRVFLDPIRDFLNLSPGSTVILIPSVRDLISTHAVYPQCEFSRLVTKSDPRIQLVPNPCKFSINDITFGATSVDVLFHLQKEKVLKRGQEVDSVVSLSPEDTGVDPLANDCRHLLQQRSFYPVFPVPFDLCSEVNLDVTHSPGLRLDDEMEDVAPDVLILPSRLRQFCKTVHSTIAINPSTLAKGVYSTINVSSSVPGKSLRERLRTEVAKIDA
ncbi:DNA polymerase alpha/epsilon subunit B-domain-containing protein [Lentinula aff. detonsa]|uniref:DNA polymerase alpha subunit B n=1 Tax=Lentinula aff. detonsa TaxID=2804958 RepID=A0AA38NN90_9AGAR|nr:DNA polymerase alpha/epsilon subunit B-domain-containing protein [Lentinula aff. detonsa]